MPDHAVFYRLPVATLAQRLDACAEAVGGKRHLAAISGVSEAQLYRYIDGDVTPPVERLEDLARAAQIDPAWLLTGRGSLTVAVDRPLPAFRSDLLVDLYDGLNDLLVEYDRPFPPKVKARAVTYLYEAFRHIEATTGEIINPDKFQLLKTLGFLAEMRTEAEVDVLRQALHALEYKGLTTDYGPHQQLLTLWCNLLVRGMRGYYNSYAGQLYFERMGQKLSADAIVELHGLVTESLKVVGKANLDWLDLGSGNGRHLAHLHKHMPNLRLRGLELADHAVALCHDLGKANKLPADCVVQGDMRQMPFPDAHFDVVFSRLSLQSLPYLPGTGLGVEAAMEEIHRVLRPGGILVLVVPEGEYRDYVVFDECFTIHSLAQVVSQQNLQNIRIVESNAQHGHFGTIAQNIPASLRRGRLRHLTGLFRKK